MANNNSHAEKKSVDFEAHVPVGQEICEEFTLW